MAGITSLSATQLINWVTGAGTSSAAVIPSTGALQTGAALSSRFLGLFTTAPTNDTGVTGATEVSGGSYARVQIAGALAVSGSSGAPITSSSTFTLASSAPAWLLALGTNGSGCNAYDLTAGKQLGTVSSITTTTVTLTGNSSNNGSLSDSILFSAFPLASNASGSEPSTTAAQAVQGATITYPTSTASWGTVSSFGIFDAVTAGNNLAWDFIGNFVWSPFTCTLASPGVLTCTDQTFINAESAVVTSKTVGSLPTGTWTGILTVAGVAGSTFNLGVNTSSAGDGLIRQVAPQAVANNTTVSFASGSLTVAAG